MIQRRRVVFGGIAAVALVCVLLQIVMEQRIGAEVSIQLQRLLGDQRYQQIMTELQTQTGQSDPQTVIQTVADEAAKKIDSLSPADQSAFLTTLVRESLPILSVVAFLLLLYFLISIWIRGYFFQIALIPGADFRELVARTTGSYFRFLGAIFATFFASCIWLPILLLPALATPFFPLFFLSVLLPFFLVPRLSLSPFLVLKGEKIRRSIGESFRRSRGSYWKIVITLFLSALCAGVVAVFLTLILSALMSLSPPSILFFFAWMREIIALLSVAFVTMTLALLSQEILGRKS